MAGVLGIYGLIVAVILNGQISKPSAGITKFSSFSGFAFLAAGLCCGLSGLAAGMAIGKFVHTFASIHHSLDLRYLCDEGSQHDAI